VAQHVRGAWSSRFHEDRLRGQADDDWAFMRLLIDEIEHSQSAAAGGGGEEGVGDGG
jgi:hypothetical protein